MALRAIIKKETTKKLISNNKSSVEQLYRSMIKELPRVLAIYDIDMPLDEAKKGVKFYFDRNKDVQDPRVISILLAKGYMELEETLMQWKQKTHLLRVLQPYQLAQKQTLTNQKPWGNQQELLEKCFEI